MFAGAAVAGQGNGVPDVGGGDRRWLLKDPSRCFDRLILRQGSGERIPPSHSPPPCHQWHGGRMRGGRASPARCLGCGRRPALGLSKRARDGDERSPFESLGAGFARNPMSEESWGARLCPSWLPSTAQLAGRPAKGLGLSVHPTGVCANRSLGASFFLFEMRLRRATHGAGFAGWTEAG